MSFSLRPIRREDDPELARVIRTVMPEFGAVGPGFAINDPEVDAMFDAYSGPRSAFFVVVDGAGVVVGGGGVAPLAKGEADTCELRKMYFLKEARGHGLGKQMLLRCLEAARAFGYKRVYLETLKNMHTARVLYERAGFKKLDSRMGDTGHFGCNSYFALDLA